MSQWSNVDAYSLLSENFWFPHFPGQPGHMWMRSLVATIEKKYDVLFETKVNFPGGTRIRKDFSSLAKRKKSPEYLATQKINREVVN